jgi:hypothetical protein
MADLFARALLDRDFATPSDTVQSMVGEGSAT